MLFYSQIKRKFQPSVWKKGQNLYWNEAVQNLSLEGNIVKAEVFDSEKKIKVQITTQRGGLQTFECECGRAKSPDQPCEHVAALSIFVVEKGSLLRAGLFINSSQDSEEDKVHESEVLRIPAEPVVFIRPLFENNVLTQITVEPALRYKDPQTGEKVIEVMNGLVVQKIPSVRAEVKKVWKNLSGLLLETVNEDVPILGRLDSPKKIHSGNAMLDDLSMIYGLNDQSRIEFHPLLQGGLDPSPLVLDKISVGKKTEKGRVLTYVYKNKNLIIDSETINLRSKKGCVSSRYFWSYEIEQVPKLYRFDVPLSMIARYANRSGITEENTAKAFKPTGFAVLEEDQNENLHPLAAYRLSLELGVENFEVDPEWKEFQEWKKNFERKKIPALPKVDYGFELRDYQMNGLSWMWSLYHRGLSALLGDDMGLGKTHQVLAFLSSLYRARGASKKPPSLVVAPKSVVAAWIHKLEKYPTGLKYSVFHGASRKSNFDKVNLVLTTYGILQKEEILRKYEWEAVILDEAQAIKNAMTISSRVARVLKAKFRIAMTGTPIENHTTDLWSVMEFLLPGYLGSLPRFKRLYGAGREITNKQHAETLKRLVQPFLLRRTKNQVLKELPEKTEEIIECPMTPIQQKIYDQYLNSQEAQKIRQDLEGGAKIDYAGVLALLTRLKQVCDHPRLPEIISGKYKKKVDPAESGKWEMFVEIMNEALGSNLKVVVFSQYLNVLDIIANWLEEQDIGYAELRGSTGDRSKPIKAFAEDPNCKVFLCSLLAGGLGIDLTAGSVCIHFDRWWNPAKENQATDRLHRYGQTRGVQVFKFQCPDTIEERIAAVIKTKTALSNALIEESDVNLNVFSREDLLKLLTVTSPNARKFEFSDLED
jgi:SNF2 family DNA or RNA helicase